MGRLLRALLSALAAALALASPAWGASGGPSGPGGSAAEAGHGGPQLTLLSQTPWVQPGQAMQLRIGVGGAAPASLTLGVTLYACLSSRSAFALTVNGSPASPALSSATIPVATLPSDPQGGVSLTIPVATGASPAPGSGPFIANLSRRDACASGPAGVYPVRLQLSQDGVTGRAQLFTYLVFADPPPTTEKLRFAWVVPLSSSAGPVDRSGHAPAPTTGEVERLDALATALAGHEDVPLTVEPVPATLAALGGSNRARARSALAALGSYAAAPGHEVLAESYVPVDATALVSAGLGGELAEQVRRAAQSLAGLHPASRIWVSGGPVDQSSVAALASLGFDHLVLPAAAVTQSPGSGLTATRPFSLSAGRGEAPFTVQSDTALSAHLAAGTGPGDALAAYQLLADLALVYYEQPNLDTPRGVVAVAPSGWAPDVTFLDTVLSSLPGDPLVTPVTLDQLFSTVAPATGSVHRPAAANEGTAGLPARQIRAARARIYAFTSALSDSGAPVGRALDDLLLVSEGTALRPSEQQRSVAGAEAALDTQLASLSIRTDTVRLTSTAAKVPITVLKQSAYSVSGTLRIVGDKVVFPPAADQDPGSICRDPKVQTSAGRSRFECTAVFGHTTNAVYVAMRARATGDFRLTVTLSTPSGSLVLTSSALTVRSMSTSFVAIALSLAAVAVLLVWWGRTVWRGRPPTRRGAHVRGAVRTT